MKFKFLFLSIIISLLSSCKSNSGTRNIIEEETFINVLTDIHMADATLVVKGFRINSDSTRIRLYYNDVLLEYNVTQKQIQNTFLHYTKNPRDFEKLYEKVSANIVKLEEENFGKNEKGEIKDKMIEKKPNELKKRS